MFAAVEGYKFNMASTEKQRSCMGCNKVMGADTDFSECPNCKSTYHPSCAERAKLKPLPNGGFKKCCSSITKADFIAILSSQMDDLKASMKSYVDDSTKALAESVQEHDKKLVELSTRIGAVESRASGYATNGDDILREVEDRQRRSVNVIVYDLKPVDGKSDLDVINGIFDQVPGLPKAVSVFRFAKGKGDIKPLKVTFQDKSDALKVLTSKAKIAPHKIYVKNDLTQAQLAHLRELRSELNLRAEKGQKNFTIRFVNGSHEIVERKSGKSKSVKN